MNIPKSGREQEPGAGRMSGDGPNIIDPGWDTATDLGNIKLIWMRRARAELCV